MRKHTMPKMLSTLLAAIIGSSAIPLEPIAYAVTSTENTASSSSVVAAEEESGSLKNGDVNKDGTIDENDVSAIASTTIAKSPQADVNADGKLDQTDADMIASLISGEIGYFPVGTYYSADTTYVTRGEWIHSLVTEFSMSASEDSEITEYYTDLADYEYGAEITLAANFGVFDVLGTEFHPDAFVTRDFAAHTMNYCLGYPNDVAITYKDVDAVYYDGDAQIALNRGWFQAENDEFRPSMYVTTTESELACADVQDVIKSNQIDENHVNTVEYADSVVRITDTKNTSIDNLTVHITGTKKEISDGDNFTFIKDDIEILRKAVSVTYDEDSDTWSIETEDADDDAVLSCDVAGRAYVDYNSVTVLYKGANLMINGKPVQYKPDNTGVATQLLNKTMSIGDTSLTVTGSVSNINVQYQWDNLSKFYLGVEADAEIKATLASKLSAESTGQLDLFSVPVWGTAGFTANIVCTATASISGELTLSYSCRMNAGIEWTLKNGFRTVKDFSNVKMTMEASATEKLGLQCAVTGKFGKHELARIYIGVGEKGTIKTVSSSDMPVVCTQLTAYLYIEVGFKVDLGFKKFANSWEVVNANNSPMRVNIHWENGKKVSKCTQGLGYNTQTGGGSYGGGESGGYSKGSGYSSGYGGGHGYGWIGKFYGATIAFKELEPALVITEDRKLTDDLEVETDLIIKAKLDLNGHKLTAKRNVYIGGWNDDSEGWIVPGELVFNKGTAEIQGNLTETSESNILMNNKADKLVVNGNTDIQGDTTFTAGTFEIKGNVVGGSINSSDMHLIVLSGTGNQDISGGGINANVLDINNSDSRTITVDSTLQADSSITIDGSTLHLICNQSRNNESYFAPTKLNGDKLIIDGNVTLGVLEFKGTEFTVNGDLLNSDSITLSKTIMTVNGNATTSKDFTLNGSTVNATGDFTHYNALNMGNKNDHINVGGELFLIDTSDSIQDGIIDVKGDVRFKNSDFNFGKNVVMTGYSKVILSGEQDVTIYAEGLGLGDGERPVHHFNDLVIQNTDKRKVYTDTYMGAASVDCGENPLNIVTRDGCLGLGTVTCSDFTVDGNCVLSGEMKFNCNSIKFNGDVVFGDTWEGNFNLNGVPTKVAGSTSMIRDTLLNGTAFSTKDFIMEYGTLTLNKGNITVSGDLTIKDGSIQMNNAKDKIVIDGDLDVQGIGDHTISAGVIQCAGDISITGNKQLNITDEAVLELTGETNQAIRVSAYENQSYYDDHIAMIEKLSVKNALNKSIALTGYLDVNELTADSDTIKITSKNGIIASAKLRCNLDITGNLVVLDNTINLNGYSVNINGDLYHHSGVIAINTGNLNITGNYLIVNDEDSAVYTVSSGILNMTNEGDKVVVDGNFITMTNQDHSEYLTAGTLEIKGDFYQYDDGTEYAFPASGTHKVILSGTDKQTVTFESYDSSHFNILSLTQDSSQYVFSDDPCWDTLNNETQNPEFSTGDVNGDHSVDMKDVTLMRRKLADWDVTINEQYADVNGDGSFDMKDVTLLRCYLANWDVTLA